MFTPAMDLYAWMLPVAAGLIVSYYVLYTSKHHGKRYPPRLGWLPVVGSLLFLPKNKPFYQICEELKLTLGPVFGLYFGTRYIVVISGFNNIYEALVEKSVVFAGRPSLKYKATIRGNPKELGIAVHSYDNEWKSQRSVVMTLMRAVGYGQNTTEEKILNEANTLLARFADQNGALFNPAKMFISSVSNVICTLLFNKTYHHTDEDFQYLLQTIKEYTSEFFAHPELEFIPLTRILPASRTYMKRYEAISKRLHDFIRDKINQRKACMVQDRPDDFIQAYLSELNKEHSRVTENWLQNIVFDFFLAGSDTTSTTLTWGLLYMIAFPDVQKRVQEEIDLVLGSGATSQPRHQPRRVALSDRSTMPYTEATIMEVQRFASLVPIALPHMTIEDVELAGYFIPKNTQVMINMRDTSRDPSIWNNPEEFSPQRFLDEDGTLLKKKEWMPFSLGRRMCLGEQLARQELFLFFTSILQRFTLESSVPLEDIDLSIDDTNSDGVVNPKYYELIMTERVVRS